MNAAFVAEIVGILPFDDVRCVSYKLVVPEEKMADHEEQLSDEEKVRCHF